jgi:hypothetical protein
MSGSVLIRGDGVAALCCLHLLTRSGVSVVREAVSRKRLPAILLSAGAQDLIRDVFEQPGLFRDLPPIRQRIVQWGAQASPVALAHSAVAVSEEYLLDRLGPAGHAAAVDPEWTIFASDPLPSSCAANRFGERFASATPVELAAAACPAACWIESMERGWLFLIAAGDGKAWLLSVGEPALEESRLIDPLIAARDDAAGHFAAAPRVSWPLCGPGWLACGTAATAFDPLCGDGTAHAVRESILACAVIRAAASGADPASLLDHYAARLAAGFERHLAICLEYYRSGGNGPWWEEQAAAAQHGIEWCRRAMSGLPPFRYRLHGFDLVPLAEGSGS